MPTDARPPSAGRDFCRRVGDFLWPCRLPSRSEARVALWALDVRLTAYGEYGKGLPVGRSLRKTFWASCARSWDFTVEPS